MTRHLRTALALLALSLGLLALAGCSTLKPFIDDTDVRPDAEVEAYLEKANPGFDFSVVSSGTEGDNGLFRNTMHTYYEVAFTAPATPGFHGEYRLARTFRDFRVLPEGLSPEESEALVEAYDDYYPEAAFYQSEWWTGRGDSPDDFRRFEPGLEFGGFEARRIVAVSAKDGTNEYQYWYLEEGKRPVLLLNSETEELLADFEAWAAETGRFSE